MKNIVLPRFRVSNVNIIFKTVYQIKAFNLFFIMKLHHENISFRSKVIPVNVLKNTCPGFRPSRHVGVSMFIIVIKLIILITLVTNLWKIIHIEPLTNTINTILWCIWVYLGVWVYLGIFGCIWVKSHTPNVMFPCLSIAFHKQTGPYIREHIIQIGLQSLQWTNIW